MKTETKKTTRHGKPSKELLLRLTSAQKDYQKLWKEVEPFVRKRSINTRSTAGTWFPWNYNVSEK